MGRFLLHVPHATFGGNVSLTRPVLDSPKSYIRTSTHSFSWGVSITRPMLVLAWSFSYTSRVSFSEEPLLHSPCWFQWAVLGTVMFNHAWIPDVSSSEWHETIDVVEFHVGRQKSYCTLILVSEKEAKSLQMRGNGKVGYSAPRLAFRAPHEIGFVGCHRNDVASMGLLARSGHRRTSSGFVSV